MRPANDQSRECHTPLQSCAPMTADMQQLNRITRRQRGLITRLQALLAGLSDGEIQGLLRRRIWIEIRPGVYAVAGAPQSWEQVVQATLLSAGPGAWASHRTGAHFWSVRRIEQPELIEVLTGLERRVTLAGVVGRRSGELFDADLTTRLGVPCVSAPRALIDTSRSMNHEQLGRALDDLLRRKLCTLDEVRRCVDRLHPGPGRPLKGMHSVLAERWPGYDPGESDLETRRSGPSRRLASRCPSSSTGCGSVASRYGSTSPIQSSRSRSRSTRGSTTAKFGHSSTAITSAVTSRAAAVDAVHVHVRDVRRVHGDRTRTLLERRAP